MPEKSFDKKFPHSEKRFIEQSSFYSAESKNQFAKFFVLAFAARSKNQAVKFPSFRRKSRVIFYHKQRFVTIRAKFQEGFFLISVFILCVFVLNFKQIDRKTSLSPPQKALFVRAVKSTKKSRGFPPVFLRSTLFFGRVEPQNKTLPTVESSKVATFFYPLRNRANVAVRPFASIPLVRCAAIRTNGDFSFIGKIGSAVFAFPRVQLFLGRFRFVDGNKIPMS